MRVAAVGDIHAGIEGDSADRLREGFEHLSDHADALLLAGDLTRCGEPPEAKVVADAVERTGVPAVAVLGNHDLHAGRGDEVVDILESAGMSVLEGRSAVLDLPGGRLGIAGDKGFGGGFAGACISEFGEEETKAFARHSIDTAARVEAALSTLDDAEARIALLHYSPVRDTLHGEPPELYPFLGSYLLAEAIDFAGADLVVHGHAHRGSERGMTPGGIRVRNVAQPVIRAAYRVFELREPRQAGSGPA
jgi:Icc-related predicted phosphoesterase